MDRIVRETLGQSARLFGPAVVDYGRIVPRAIAESAGYKYSFVETDSFMTSWHTGRVSETEVNRVVAAEVLDIAHMAAVTSIFRAHRWMESAWQEVRSGNVYGAANAFRGLLEAVGDAAVSLGGIGLTFAEKRQTFTEALEGRVSGVALTFSQIEDALIHYAHGRRLRKSEKASTPEQHEARPATEYIDFFSAASLPAARPLYSRLCELGHPSRSSIDFLYVGDGNDGFRIDILGEQGVLEELLNYTEIWEAIPSMAFNPGLLTLRVLDVLGRYPPVPSLTQFEFQSAPIWKRIKPLLE